MSLKKEIMALLKKDEGVVKLNNVSYLTRWTKDAFNEDIDCLQLQFKFIGGITGGVIYDVGSRDYDGIIAEVHKYTTEYFNVCALQLNKNLTNGYR